MEKYSLVKTDTKQTSDGTTLYRIKANVSFGNVVKGELGGYIGSRKNLAEVGNARVSGNADLLIIGEIGSRRATLTFTKSDKSAATGCYRGTIDDFEKQVTKTHGNNQYAKVYRAAIALSKIFFGFGED